MQRLFLWQELLFYLLPFVMIVVIQKYFRSYLKFFKKYPLTLAQVILPTELVLIYAFGWLVFGYNLVPLILFLTAALLGFHLYDYILYIKEFSYKSYWQVASKYIFLAFSGFLLSLMALRLMTYFI